MDVFRRAVETEAATVSALNKYNACIISLFPATRVDEPIGSRCHRLLVKYEHAVALQRRALAEQQATDKYKKGSDVQVACATLKQHGRCV